MAVNYRSSAEAAATTVAAIEDAGGEAASFAADVGEGDAVADMIGEVEDRWGRVSVLVNNAGITADDLLLRMKPAAWDSVIRTNLTSAFGCTQAVLRPMTRRVSLIF